MIRATLYSDAACPWAYSANPALRVLEWRYGEQLAWRLVMIGLRDEPSSARFEPARVDGLPVAVNMVLLVAHTTVRAAKDPLARPMPSPKKRRASSTPLRIPPRPSTV